MVNRSPLCNSFEFVMIAALRAQQLQRGCLPRVGGNHKRTTIAQMEIVAGKVARVPVELNVPPGTRTSLYQNPEYLKVAPFAKPTLASIDAADPNHPTVQPVPYVGVQYAAIPEFQGIGTTVGQQFSAALSGASTVDAALAAAQSSTEREMKRAGYIK